MNYIVAGLYLTGIVLLVVLMRRSLDKPITLCLSLTNAGWLVYSLVSRMYRILADTNDVSIIYSNVAVSLYTLATLAMFLLALRFDSRIRAGRSFTGPDGRRWGVREAKLPTGDAVKVTLPVHILDAQVRAHQRAKAAEAAADEVREPLRAEAGD